MSFITKTVSNYRTSQSSTGKIFIGISGVSALLAAWNYIQSKTVQGEFETRKSQLSKPIYKLTEEEMINPPWNESNLDQWLYRRVEVTGRPIHRLQCMIPRQVSGKPGFQCIVPLVARQNNDRTEREGILFSRGFIPEFFRPIGNRYKFEDVSPQTFVGFVSTLPQLKNHGIFEGNAIQEARLNFTNSNLDDLAKGTGLKNYKQARVAVVQRLYQTGLLNERHGQRYNHDADQSVDYPYYKTQAGALQLPMNPWDYKNQSLCYFGASLASFIVGASLF